VLPECRYPSPAAGHQRRHRRPRAASSSSAFPRQHHDRPRPSRVPERDGNATIAGGQTLTFLSGALYDERKQSDDRSFHRQNRRGRKQRPARRGEHRAERRGRGRQRRRWSLRSHAESAKLYRPYTTRKATTRSPRVSCFGGTTVDAGNRRSSAQRTTTKNHRRRERFERLSAGGATLQGPGGASVTTGTDGNLCVQRPDRQQFRPARFATDTSRSSSACRCRGRATSSRISRCSPAADRFAIGDPSVSPASAGANADVTSTRRSTTTGSSSARWC